MLKKEIRICDICEITIAGKGKCEICDNDCCEDCILDYDIDFMEISLNNIKVCSECSSKIDDLKKRRAKIDKKDEIKESMIGYIKKMLILKALENKKEE